MQKTEKMNLPVGKQFMSVTEISKKTDISSTTTPMAENTLQKFESKENQVEVLRHSEDVLREGVIESMRIVDSSASALNVQMKKLLTAEDEEVRRPAEWQLQKAVECGMGIVALLRAKTEAMKLLNNNE